MSKISLAAEKLYILKSVLTKPTGEKHTSYYMTPVMWNTSPTEATIFRDYDAANAHLLMYHERDKAPKGWADGSTETIDVVPLYGELAKLANGG